MLNPYKEPLVSSKAPNQYFEDMDSHCTFGMNIESQVRNMDVSETSDHIQVKIKMQNPSQKPPAPIKIQIRT